MSSRKRSREKELHAAQNKYQKVTGKAVPNKFKNDIKWLNKQIKSHVSTATTTTTTTTTTTKATSKRVPGSTQNVKNLLHLLIQRPEFQGWSRVEKYSVLIHKLSPAEEKEFAEIVKLSTTDGGVYSNFLRVKQQYEAAAQKVKEKKKERDDLVEDLPKLKRALTKTMDDMESLLEDIPPPIQEQIVKVFHDTFEAKMKALAERPLYAKLSEVVNKYDEGEKQFTLEEYEKKIGVFDEEIKLAEIMLKHAKQGENQSKARAQKEKAEQRKQAFQKKHGAAKKTKSVAKKKMFRGWKTPNLARKLLFLEEFQRRGLKSQAPMPDEVEEETSEEQDGASSSGIISYFTSAFRS